MSALLYIYLLIIQIRSLTTETNGYEAGFALGSNSILSVTHEVQHNTQTLYSNSMLNHTDGPHLSSTDNASEKSMTLALDQDCG